MKTKKDLKQLKEEAANPGKKLNVLNDDELKEVTGGRDFGFLNGGDTVAAKEKDSSGLTPQEAEKIVG